MRRCLSGRCNFSTGRRVGGSLYVWGRVGDGRLGMKAPESCYTATNLARPGGPTTGPLLHPTLRDVVSVVCRGMKTLALTADGSVYSWGTCENFSLGHGDKVSQVATPTKIAALAGIRIVQVRGLRVLLAAPFSH
jgi:alpha-tubulin suppressor-like RCC1 family protein